MSKNKTQFNKYYYKYYLQFFKNIYTKELKIFFYKKNLFCYWHFFYFYPKTITHAETLIIKPYMLLCAQNFFFLNHKFNLFYFSTTKKLILFFKKNTKSWYSIFQDKNINPTLAVSRIRPVIKKNKQKFYLYMYLYLNFFNYSILRLKKHIGIATTKFSNYYLLLNFRYNNTLFTTLRLVSHLLNKNLLFTSPGMFIKFFQKKKSLKKHKLTKFLTIKFIRKLLVIAKIWKLNLIVKKTPSMLIELIRYFQQPVYLYLNKSKTDEKNLNEIQKKKKAKVEFFPPLFLFYFFIETKSYVKNKIRKKGRIKRKITRKLILTQNIID